MAKTSQMFSIHVTPDATIKMHLSTGKTWRFCDFKKTWIEITDIQNP